MDGAKIAPVRQCLSDLPRRRTFRVQHHRFHPWAEPMQQRLSVIDQRIEKQYFRARDHRTDFLIFWSIRTPRGQGVGGVSELETCCMVANGREGGIARETRHKQ